MDSMEQYDLLLSNTTANRMRARSACFRPVAIHRVLQYFQADTFCKMSLDSMTASVASLSSLSASASTCYKCRGLISWAPCETLSTSLQWLHVCRSSVAGRCMQDGCSATLGRPPSPSILPTSLTSTLPPTTPVRSSGCQPGLIASSSEAPHSSRMHLRYDSLLVSWCPHGGFSHVMQTVSPHVQRAWQAQ